MVSYTKLIRTINWLVTLLLPIFIILATVRLVLTPIYVNLEYRMPGFPPDPYGFSFDERLKWANITSEYLLNSAGIEYLSDLKFDDGSPLYNQRELRHMLDVKVVVRGVMRVFVLVIFILLAIGFWAKRSGWTTEFRHALARGGRLTVGLISVIIFLILVNFNTIFVAFHRVFFEGNSWLFSTSDTLIRLFPVRFWRDIFILVGLITLAGGFVFSYFSERKYK